MLDAGLSQSKRAKALSGQAAKKRLAEGTKGKSDLAIRESTRLLIMAML